MSEAKLRALQDPEKRERVSKAASATLKAWHSEREPAPSGRRARALSDPRTVRRGLLWKVPATRREEYIRLQHVHRMTAQQAYDAIIEDELKQVRRRMGLARDPNLRA